MIKNIVIAILGIVAVAEGVQIRTLERQQSEIVAQAIQDTSDATLAACEEKIDHIEDNCADMIEDAIQEMLEQF